MAGHAIADRYTLKQYALRRLGEPVIEVNVDDDQIEDLMDDALQYFQERHFDGIEKVYLKHELTADEITKMKESTASSVGIATTAVTSVTWTESNNFLQLPDHVIGVDKVFKMDASTISSGLFNIKYQIFLNDLYYYGALDLMNYAMTKTYLEDLSRIITPDTQIRFNKRNNKLYLDIDWSQTPDNTWMIIDCWRILDPSKNADIFNDWWLKKYFVATLKRQWGQNLIKFNGVLLPGGVALNGREIYEDAIREIEVIEEQLRKEYELPPMDLIG